MVPDVFCTSSPAVDPDSRRQRICATVDSIPAGRVATYGQVAREAGLPRRARLVGAVLRTLPAGSRLPWHRVVNAKGEISPRPGSGPREQARRLRREGVSSDPRGRVCLTQYGWDGS